MYKNHQNQFMAAPVQFKKNRKHYGSNKGNVASLTLTPQSAVLVNNDPDNLSHLSAAERLAISQMSNQIHQLHKELFHRQNNWSVDGNPAFELFQNKHFNKMRLKYINLNAKEIRAQLKRIWVEQMSEDDRTVFALKAQEQTILGTKVQTPVVDVVFELNQEGDDKTV